LDWIYIFDCLYSILKQTQYWKKKTSPFLLKNQLCIFSHKAKIQNKLEPLTIKCELKFRNDSRVWIENCVLLMI